MLATIFKNLRGVLAAAGIFFALALSWFRVFEPYELATYDWRFQLRGPRPVSDRIVHIDIWNDTLEALGAWPIERVYHAGLIDALNAAGAKAVVFDVIFAEPRAGDQEVAASAKAAGNVYFAEAFSGDRMTDPLIPAYRLAAKGTGFVNAKIDVDGKVRRVLPEAVFGGQKVHQLAFLVARDLLGGRAPEVPLDEEGCFLINFAGLWEKSFQHYSYLDVLRSYAAVLNGEKPSLGLNSLKDKICFVGLSTTGSHDVRATPVGPAYPMVGTHSNVLNGILQGDFVRRLPRFWNLLVLLTLGMWTAWASSRAKPLMGLLSTGLTALGFVAAACLVFAWAGIWVDLFWPLVVMIGIYLAATLSRAMAEKRKREMVENELKVASRIQQSFLPACAPSQKGMGLSVFMRPAKAVGGDLYAFMRPGEGKLGVMVGDVSGKGTPAALFMAKVVSEFKFAARDKTDPAAVLKSLNDSVSSESTGGLFVTMVYAIFDVPSRRLALSDAGHLPAVACDPKGIPRFLKTNGGPPIGVMCGAEYSSIEVPLHEGDCFAFYSDGVTEARNRKKEEFGADALCLRMAESAGFSSDGILSRLTESLRGFMGKADQHDDITLIVAKINDAANG